MTIESAVEFPPPSLSVSAVPSGPRLFVAVAGEADWVTADELRDQLAQALEYAPRSLVLDLAGLEFCNLRGLCALRDFCDGAQQASVDVTVRGMPRQLSWLIDTVQTVLAGGSMDRGRGRRPLLRAVGEMSTGVGGSWDSRSGG